MRITTRVLNATAAVAAIGFLAAYLSAAPASAAMRGPKCAPHQSHLNGECVDDAFIDPDRPNSCAKGACYRRGGHKGKTHRTNK